MAEAAVEFSGWERAMMAAGKKILLSADTG